MHYLNYCTLISTKNLKGCAIWSSFVSIQRFDLAYGSFKHATIQKLTKVVQSSLICICVIVIIAHKCILMNLKFLQFHYLIATSNLLQKLNHFTFHFIVLSTFLYVILHIFYPVLLFSELLILKLWFTSRSELLVGMSWT